MPHNRKISVSFVSEPAPTGSNDPAGLLADPVLKALQQKILRLQVIQVVLGLTLMVLSAVAIIEERIFFSLGFGLFSALLAIFSAVLGIQQYNLRFVIGLNMTALLGLLPAFYFTCVSLVDNFKATQQEWDEADWDVGRSRSRTIWVLGWLHLMHLLPLSICLLYILCLLRILTYYLRF